VVICLLLSHSTDLSVIVTVLICLLLSHSADVSVIESQC
jgi:hypothetical protein